MRIAIDYDGTIIRQDLPYDDVTSTPTFEPHAVEALHALKAAGHFLILYSARNNRWLRTRSRTARLNQLRFERMVAHVDQTLAGVFDVIDNGTDGKPSADLFIDDKAVRYGRGDGALDWWELGEMLGDLADNVNEDVSIPGDKPVPDDEVERAKPGNPLRPAPLPSSKAPPPVEAALASLLSAERSQGRGERLIALQEAQRHVMRAITGTREASDGD